MNPNEWVSAAERIANKGVGFGFALFVVSLFYYGAFSFELITKSELTIAAFDWAQIGLALSTGILLIGVLTWLLKLLVSGVKYLGRFIQSPFKNRKHRTRAYQDICMLSSDARILLWFYMRHPDGRFTAPGPHGPIGDLFNKNLIEFDTDPDSFNFLISQGTSMRVSKVALSKSVKSSTAELVKRDFPLMQTDDQLINMAAQTSRKIYRFP